jgi:hypothetical protein
MNKKGENILSFPQQSKPEQRPSSTLSPARRELQELEHESLRTPYDKGREARIRTLKKQLGK